MLNLTHLRHISLFTPNFEEQVQFYEEIWGLDVVERDNDNIYLRGAGPEHHILHLRNSDQRGVHHIAFGLVDKKAVDEAAIYLKENNIKVVQEPGYLDEAGKGYGLRFVDFENRCIELSAWVETNTVEWSHKHDTNPLFLNHIVFNTADIDRAVEFYTNLLGFKVSDWSEDQMCFLRCNKNHHSIAFNRAEHASVNHIAYEVNNVDELMRGIARVRSYEYKEIWGPGRHGPGDNVFCYFQDPGGFVMEYTCYILNIEDEEKYDAKVWKRTPRLSDRWGVAGPPTPETRAAMAGTPDHGWVK